MKQKQPALGRQIAIPGIGLRSDHGARRCLSVRPPCTAAGLLCRNRSSAFPRLLGRVEGETRPDRIRVSGQQLQGPSADGADFVVCWENDWETRPQKYRHLKIISLKPHVGAQRRIYAVGCDESISGDELRSRYVDWNVPVSAEIGDLVLMYRKAPTSAIRDLWEIVDPPKLYEKGNTKGYRPGIQAGLRRVVSLKRPLTFEKLSRDPQTKELSVVHKRFQGKTEITDDWPLICEKIVGLNPRAKSSLRPYVVG